MTDREIEFIVKALNRYAHPKEPNGVPQRILLDAISVIRQLLHERDEARAKIDVELIE